MTNVLIIDSAATGDKSVSRKLTDRIRRSSAPRPAVRIVHRDVGRRDRSRISPRTRSRPSAARPRRRPAAPPLALSTADRRAPGRRPHRDRRADVQFRHPSTLKAWFDHVLRAGITFRYTAEGPGGAGDRQARDRGRKRAPASTAKARPRRWTARSRTCAPARLHGHHGRDLRPRREARLRPGSRRARRDRRGDRAARAISANWRWPPETCRPRIRSSFRRSGRSGKGDEHDRHPPLPHARRTPITAG
jgi:hypothetical protein